MTSAEKILKDIAADAAAAAAEQIKAAQLQAQAQTAQAAVETARAVAQVERETDETIAEIQRNAISSAALVERDLYLSSRRLILKKTLQEALRRIDKMEDAAYFDFLWDCLKPHITAGTLYLSKKDLSRDTADFSRRLQEAGITLSDTPRAIDGGFVLVAGEVEINATLSALVHEKQFDLLDEVHYILFESERVNRRG